MLAEGATPTPHKAKSKKKASAKPLKTSGHGDSVNIQVAVRVRPLPGANSAERLSAIDGNQLTIKGTPNGQPEKFIFDYLYGTDATQVQVFEDLGTQILDHAFEGYNATIFAYGQTGSGKSHSIMGTGADVGIIPRLAVSLFERVREAEDASFEVTATYLELYNEVRPPAPLFVPTCCPSCLHT